MCEAELLYLEHVHTHLNIHRRRTSTVHLRKRHKFGISTLTSFIYTVGHASGAACIRLHHACHAVRERACVRSMPHTYVRPHVHACMYGGKCGCDVREHDHLSLQHSRLSNISIPLGLLGLLKCYKKSNSRILLTVRCNEIISACSSFQSDREDLYTSLTAMGQKRNRIHAPISHRLSGSLSRVLGEPDAEADGTNLAPHRNSNLRDWDNFTTRDLLHLDCPGQCQPIKAACSQQALNSAGKQAAKDEQGHPVAERKTADRSAGRGA